MLQHRHRRCKLESVVFIRKFQQPIDQTRIERISATDALDDMGDLIVPAFDELFPVIQASRPRIVRCAA
jgi:hypothetical protein